MQHADTHSLSACSRRHTLLCSMQTHTSTQHADTHSHSACRHTLLCSMQTHTPIQHAVVDTHTAMQHADTHSYEAQTSSEHRKQGVCKYDHICTTGPAQDDDLTAVVCIVGDAAVVAISVHGWQTSLQTDDAGGVPGQDPGYYCCQELAFPPPPPPHTTPPPPHTHTHPCRPTPRPCF